MPPWPHCQELAGIRILLLRCRVLAVPRHQPVAVLFLLPPSEALEIFLFTGRSTQQPQLLDWFPFSLACSEVATSGPLVHRATCGSHCWDPRARTGREHGEVERKIAMRFYLLGAWFFELLGRLQPHMGHGGQWACPSAARGVLWGFGVGLGLGN